MNPNNITLMTVTIISLNIGKMETRSDIQALQQVKEKIRTTKEKRL
jgi:hypothetical protein